MDNDKPRLFSPANRHQLLMQVFAGLLVALIIWLAVWVWSELGSSDAAQAANGGLTAAWNWASDQLSAEITIARWTVLLLSFAVVMLLVVTLISRMRSIRNSRRVEVVSAVDEPKLDALEQREELALVLLATDDWLDDEANANELAEKLGSNIHAAELALVGLHEKGYVKDTYHSGYRWFKLSTKGQQYAIKEGIVKDLDLPF